MGFEKAPSFKPAGRLRQSEPAIGGQGGGGRDGLAQGRTGFDQRRAGPLEDPERLLMIVLRESVEIGEGEFGERDVWRNALLR
jgi:hypothetical protein